MTSAGQTCYGHETIGLLQGRPNDAYAGLRLQELKSGKWIPPVMAKKKSTRLAAGSPIRVKDGVKLPEFPEQSISGWTGTVAEQKGRGADLQYIIEWDDTTVDAMPQSYKDHCETNGLFYRMVCLPADQVDELTG